VKCKVSVCITTYNRAPALDRTLASLATQTRIPDEVVVSDDCSPDNTEEVTRRWASVLPVKYFRNVQNLGMPGNLNAAIGRASGEYIANLHDADTFEPSLLERWERALDEYPSAGFVFCGVGGWPARMGQKNILHDVEPYTRGRDFYESHLIHRFASIVWGTVMARRTAYDGLLPFDATFGFISDVDMWMRMCLHYDVAYVRAPLIKLDHSPTKERNKTVNWQWVEWMRAIQMVNLRRFYGGDPERHRREQVRLRIAAGLYLARRIAGRAWHRDRHGMSEALRLWRAWELTRLQPQGANG
jgi:glycosyltransferase involved in cell wall biosynthesis